MNSSILIVLLSLFAIILGDPSKLNSKEKWWMLQESKDIRRGRSGDVMEKITLYKMLMNDGEDEMNIPDVDFSAFTVASDGESDDWYNDWSDSNKMIKKIIINIEKDANGLDRRKRVIEKDVLIRKLPKSVYPTEKEQERETNILKRYGFVRNDENVSNKDKQSDSISMFNPYNYYSEKFGDSSQFDKKDNSDDTDEHLKLLTKNKTLMNQTKNYEMANKNTNKVKINNNLLDTQTVTLNKKIRQSQEIANENKSKLKSLNFMTKTEKPKISFEDLHLKSNSYSGHLQKYELNKSDSNKKEITESLIEKSFDSPAEILENNKITLNNRKESKNNIKTDVNSIKNNSAINSNTELYPIPDFNIDVDDNPSKLLKAITGKNTLYNKTATPVFKDVIKSNENSTPKIYDSFNMTLIEDKPYPTEIYKAISGGNRYELKQNNTEFNKKKTHKIKIGTSKQSHVESISINRNDTKIESKKIEQNTVNIKNGNNIPKQKINTYSIPKNKLGSEETMLHKNKIKSVPNSTDSPITPIHQRTSHLNKVAIDMEKSKKIIEKIDKNEKSFVKINEKEPSNIKNKIGNHDSLNQKNATATENKIIKNVINFETSQNKNMREKNTEKLNKEKDRQNLKNKIDLKTKNKKDSQQHIQKTNVNTEMGIQMDHNVDKSKKMSHLQKNKDSHDYGIKKTETLVKKQSDKKEIAKTLHLKTHSDYESSTEGQKITSHLQKVRENEKPQIVDKQITQEFKKKEGKLLDRASRTTLEKTTYRNNINSRTENGTKIIEKIEKFPHVGDQKSSEFSGPPERSWNFPAYVNILHNENSLRPSKRNDLPCKMRMILTIHVDNNKKQCGDY